MIGTRFDVGTEYVNALARASDPPVQSQVRASVDVVIGKATSPESRYRAYLVVQDYVRAGGGIEKIESAGRSLNEFAARVLQHKQMDPIARPETVKAVDAQIRAGETPENRRMAYELTELRVQHLEQKLGRSLGEAALEVSAGETMRGTGVNTRHSAEVVRAVDWLTGSLGNAQKIEAYEMVQRSVDDSVTVPGANELIERAAGLLERANIPTKIKSLGELLTILDENFADMETAMESNTIKLDLALAVRVGLDLSPHAIEADGKIGLADLYYIDADSTRPTSEQKYSADVHRAAKYLLQNDPVRHYLDIGAGQGSSEIDGAIGQGDVDAALTRMPGSPAQLYRLMTDVAGGNGRLDGRSGASDLTAMSESHLELARLLGITDASLEPMGSMNVLSFSTAGGKAAAGVIGRLSPEQLQRGNALAVDPRFRSYSDGDKRLIADTFRFTSDPATARKEISEVLNAEGLSGPRQTAQLADIWSRHQLR